MKWNTFDVSSSVETCQHIIWNNFPRFKIFRRAKLDRASLNHIRIVHKIINYNVNVQIRKTLTMSFQLRNKASSMRTVGLHCQSTYIDKSGMKVWLISIFHYLLYYMQLYDVNYRTSPFRYRQNYKYFNQKTSFIKIVSFEYLIKA